MAVGYLLLVVALVWLDELHGALGRSLLVRHGERGTVLANALRPASMEVSRARARHNETHYWAGYITEEGEYYGTVARINVWGLKLRPGQASISAMWLSSDGDGGIHQIMAGFQISPDAYNDTDPHFFVSWTADGYNTTGCLDTSCPGFVMSTHAASSISPGSPVSQPSVYHGRQTEFTITVLKDRGAARGWWLYVDVGGKQEPVGHFPASLFAGGLAIHATEIGWGGAVQSAAGTVPLPPMGSGHGPDEEAGGSAYIADIGVFRSSTGKGNPSPIAPAAANLTALKADARGCYRASTFEIAQHDGDAFFYYGGRGGCDE